MYCRQCLYSLNGFAEPRCPECGTAFDPADPATFSQTPTLGFWGTLAAAARKHRRVFLVCGLLIVLFILEETCCSWSREQQACANCGARRQVRAFGILGLKWWTYGEALNEGPVSHFVQAINGKPCVHAWDGYSFVGGGLLNRRTGSGGGSRIWLSLIEHSFPDPEALLRKRAAMDPAFVPAFLDCIRTDDDDRQFLHDFWTWALGQSSSPSGQTPATAASERVSVGSAPHQ